MDLVLKSEQVLHPHGVAEIVQAKADLEETVPVENRASGGMRAEIGQPVGRQQDDGVEQRAQGAEKRRQAKRTPGQGADCRVDPQMQSLLESVTHTQQDHPGKQNASEFKRAAPA